MEHLNISKTAKRDIGQKIRKCREALNMSQAALAQKINKHFSIISVAEMGKNLSVDTLGKVAEALGVRVKDLMNGHGEWSAETMGERLRIGSLSDSVITPGSKQLGRTMRKLRLWKNLTQDELGKLINVSGGFIYLIEAGKRVPRPEILSQLGTYLGVEAGYLANQLTGKVDEPTEATDAGVTDQSNGQVKASPRMRRGKKIKTRRYTKRAKTAVFRVAPIAHTYDIKKQFSFSHAGYKYSLHEVSEPTKLIIEKE